MDVTTFTNKIDFIVIDYKAKLALLDVENIPVHEHGEKWNEMQHSLLNKIEVETKAFMSQRGNNSKEDYTQLVDAARGVLTSNNIRITVVPN